MTIPTDRRASPRHRVSCLAELASGVCVVPVRVGEVSDSGCRVMVLDGGAPGRLGATGLLALGAPGRARAVVPVALRHVRVEAGALCCGLAFRPMSPRRAGRLASVVADLLAGLAPAGAVRAGGAGPAAARA